MKESEWRSRLIRVFKEQRGHVNDFIWAMDAKFKRGFPDIYLILDGVDKPKHYELKCILKPPKDAKTVADMVALFEPLQIAVMNTINKAGGDARGLVKFKASGEVWMVDFHQNKLTVFNQPSFLRYWVTSCHSWEEAEEC